jgi:hypothetical protein
MAVIGLTVGLIAGASGLAVAYFTSSGTGTGTATVGHATDLTITQVGTAYDSLTPDGTYVQDQTYGGAGVTEFGNEIKLTSGGVLGNVVVAFRNWGGALTAFPVTFNIFNPGDTSPDSAAIGSVTVDANFAASVGGNPSTSTVTFDFSSLDLTVPQTLVYGVAYAGAGTNGPGSSLNVALSSSGSDLSIGTDPFPGTVYVNLLDSTWIGGWQVDTGVCSTTPSYTGFASTDVWAAAPGDCTSNTENNAGAYQNAQGADIPAVEFNVDGVTNTPPLYPGEPAQPITYIISNPGSSPVGVTGVTTSISSISGANDNAECAAGNWFTITQGTYSGIIPGGGSVTDNTASIAMVESGTNQDACENATLNLGFATNP